MDLSVTFFALAIPAVVFAGISKGGFASGASFAATPLLALILPPGEAVGLMLPLLMMMDVAALKAFWGQWDRQRVRILLIGAVPGIALGAVLAGITNPDVFRLLIGLVSVGFVIFQLARRMDMLNLANYRMGARGGVIAGLAGGFTSFVSHAGGPPTSIYLLTQGLSKTAYQATTIPVFWVMNLLKFIPYMMLGFFSHETLVADILLAPAALVGVVIGVWMHRKIPERLFFAASYLLLLVTGGKLIWDALT